MVAGTAATAFGAVIVKGVSKVAEYGDEIDKNSQKMGMSAESYQEWDFVMQHCGTTITAMQTGMKTLATAAETGNEAFEKLGLSQEEIANMDQEDLFDATITALQNVESETERTYLAGKLLGRGATELGPLLNMSAEETQYMKESVHELGGVMSDEAVKSAAAYQDSLQDMKTSFGGVVNTILGDFLPAITQIMDSISELIVKFGNLDDTTRKIIETIVAVVAVGGPVLTLIGSLFTGVSKIIGAVSSAAGAIQSLGTVLGSVFAAAGPVGIAIAAIAAIVAAIIVLWNTNEDFRNAVKEIWESVTGFFKEAWEKIQAAWSNATEFFTGIWEGISSAFAGVVEFFGGLFTAAWEAIQTVWEGAVEFFTGLWEKIQEVFATVADVLGGLFTEAWEAVQSAWETAVEFFTGVWDGISGVFSNVVEYLGGKFVDAYEAAKQAWDAAVEFFRGVWDDISGAFEGAAEWFGGVFSDAWAALKKPFTGVASFFGGVWTGIKSAFSGVSGYFSGIGSSIVESIKSGLSNKWSSFTSWLSSIVKSIPNIVINALTGGSTKTTTTTTKTSSRRSVLGSYATGSDYVPETGLYQLHEGEAVLTREENASRRSSGDTYNFYSPKALDAVSAAREMKKAKKQLAMGF